MTTLAILISLPSSVLALELEIKTDSINSRNTDLSSNLTAIYTIQGSESSSVFASDGQAYTIRGVVIGDFQNSNELSGFFIQDLVGDNNASTSDGIFISAPNSIDVRLGDLVEVTGEVSEFFDRTQINNIDKIEIISSGNTIKPIKVNLPFANANSLERYEGMLTVFPQNLTVTDTFNLGRFGEIVLSSGGRLLQPTNVVTPGSEAKRKQAQNDLNRLILDDRSTEQNSDPIPYPSRGLTASKTLRTGDTIGDLTGVIDYSFGNYRLQATVNPRFVRTNPRPNKVPNVGGTLKIASFNLLNYFNGNGAGSGFPTSRGADTLIEFKRQRAKTIEALIKLDCDLIGVLEVENDGYGPDSAIQDLVNGMNANQTESTYAFVDPNLSRLGNDEIAVGLIYRTDTLNQVGIATTSNKGAFSELNRQPLAQTFADVLTGERFTVAVNHFKSKRRTGTGTDADSGDGQGNWNKTRITASLDLLRWLNSNPTGVNDPDILIIGDLNAYAKEDPITTILETGYIDLIDRYNVNPYSYNFNGQFGYLDHALASPTLASQITGSAEWHINSDEPRILDYNTEFKSPAQIDILYNVDSFRTSDHDPLIVGLKLSSN